MAHGSGWTTTRRLSPIQQFWHSLGLTGLFTLLSVSISLVLAILLALLFNKELPGFLLLRTIVLIPMLVTPIAVGIIWRTMMNAEHGLLNYLLLLIGVDPQPWIGSSSSAFACVLLVDVWEWTPFLFIIILAGLAWPAGESVRGRGHRRRRGVPCLLQHHAADAAARDHHRRAAADDRRRAHLRHRASC